MNLNFLVNNLSSSQLSYYLISNINKDIKKRETIDCDHIIFFEDIARLCLQPICALMHLHESYGAEGFSIATCCGTAEKLLRSVGQSSREKFLYVWDLEWLRGQGSQRKFEYFSNIYGDPSLQLIGRSKEHAKIIKNCFNREVCGVVDNFNIEEIEQIVDKGV